jgi:hypothetical protein
MASSFLEADVHNIRAAFVAGFAYAMDKAVLILQPADGPAPLDVRDLVKSYRRAEEIGDYIVEFALDITERMQAEVQLELPVGNFLSGLSIGDPVAENEMQSLGRYYLRTDQFGRASRGEVNLVVGRKGSGKTALFSQLRDEKRRDKSNVIVDLKPEGYQLIRLKEDVLDFLAEGARNHLITAFFEYVFHLEICYKLLEKDRERHNRDRRLYDPYRRLLEVYESGEAGGGDFSERLLSLSQRLILDFQTRFGGQSNLRLNTAQVTELVYKHNIREVRDALAAYLVFKGSVWVLFDNLDKSWSTQGVQSTDILILRCLIDAARKMQREMQSSGRGLDFHCVVFVRNDIYQLLVQTSADYGKESRAVLDWNDPDLLREMLRRRLVQNGVESSTPFGQIWPRVCVPLFSGEESSQYLVERSLMRPRNLLKLAGHCLSFAVNLGHDRIDEDDITKGLRAYSVDLIQEAEQELRDIMGSDDNLIHHFVGEGDTFSSEKLQEILRGANFAEERVAKAIDTLLYYGFIGLHYDGTGTKYIFDVGYDFASLKVLAKKKHDTLLYVLHPAFHLGLNS